MKQFIQGIKDGSAIGIGYFSVSFTFGLAAVSSGLQWWEALLVSIMNLTSAGQFAGITVMVQKEVAERMQAKPGNKDYGALSLAVQYYAAPYLVANVPPNCFMPRPSVGSAVIRLTCYVKPPVSVKDEALMFRLIRASFNQRRKTLQNGLTNAPELPFTKEEIGDALKAVGLPPSVRGETLTLEQFGALADYFVHQKIND